MSIRTTLPTAALAALALCTALSLGAGPARADVHCSIPPGGHQPICLNDGGHPGGAAIGAVVARPAEQPRCYYLPTTANGAVNGLRKVCQ